MADQTPNWYGDWIRTPEMIAALDVYYQGAFNAFLANDAVKSNLNDDEAILFRRFVETQLRNAALLARSEDEAMELIAREHAHLKFVASTINLLIDDLESFPRKTVIKIIVEFLKAFA